MQFFFDDGNQHVSGHGAPDLRLNRILARAQKVLDAQMLLDPFEEQFHLPTTLVQRGDGQGRQGRVVGQKHQRLSRLGVFVSNAPQLFGISFRHVKAVKRNRLIANHAGRSVGLDRINAMRIHAAFRARHKETPRLMHFVQAGEIQIASIHHVKRARFDGQDVEHIDIPHLAVADVDERGNCAAQVQQRMHLHRRFGLPKWSPVEQTQAQVDGGGVQRVNRGIEFDGHRLFEVQLSRSQYQSHRQCVIDVPVAIVQRIRQRRTCWRTFQSHMKQLCLIGRETRLNVAQGLAPRQLREGHHAKQIGAIQGADSRIAVVPFDDATEILPRHVLHDLRKQRLAHVHVPPPVVKT